MDWFDEKVWPVIANRAQAFESLKVQNEIKLKLKGKQHKESRQLKKKKIPSYGNFMRL